MHLVLVQADVGCLQILCQDLKRAAIHDGVVSAQRKHTLVGPLYKQSIMRSLQVLQHHAEMQVHMMVEMPICHNMSGRCQH